MGGSASWFTSYNPLHELSWKTPDPDGKQKTIGARCPCVLWKDFGLTQSRSSSVEQERELFWPPIGSIDKSNCLRKEVLLLVRPTRAARVAPAPPIAVLAQLKTGQWAQFRGRAGVDAPHGAVGPGRTPDAFGSARALCAVCGCLFIHCDRSAGAPHLHRAMVSHGGSLASRAGLYAVPPMFGLWFASRPWCERRAIFRARICAGAGGKTTLCTGRSVWEVDTPMVRGALQHVWRSLQNVYGVPIEFIRNSDVYCFRAGFPDRGRRTRGRRT